MGEPSTEEEVMKEKAGDLFLSFVAGKYFDPHRPANGRHTL